MRIKDSDGIVLVFRINDLYCVFFANTIHPVSPSSSTYRLLSARSRVERPQRLLLCAFHRITSNCIKIQYSVVYEWFLKSFHSATVRYSSGRVTLRSGTRTCFQVYYACMRTLLQHYCRKIINDGAVQMSTYTTPKHTCSV